MRIILLCLMLLMVTPTVFASAIHVGDEGSLVLLVQQKLTEQGYDIEADGVYGQSTKEAVISYQLGQGLEADGIVGEETMGLLTGREQSVSRGSIPLVRRILSRATSLIGVPYVFGGTSPQGFDCSGFVQYVYRSAGINLPRTADEQYAAGKRISGALTPGDLVFFSTYEPGPSHSGIYVGNNRFISATSSRGIQITSLSEGYWASRYIGAKRII